MLNTTRKERRDPRADSEEGLESPPPPQTAKPPQKFPSRFAAAESHEQSFHIRWKFRCSARSKDRLDLSQVRRAKPVRPQISARSPPRQTESGQEFRTALQPCLRSEAASIFLRKRFRMKLPRQLFDRVHNSRPRPIDRIADYRDFSIFDCTQSRPSRLQRERFDIVTYRFRVARSKHKILRLQSHCFFQTELEPILPLVHYRPRSRMFEHIRDERLSADGHQWLRP